LGFGCWEVGYVSFGSEGGGRGGIGEVQGKIGPGPGTVLKQRRGAVATVERDSPAGPHKESEGDGIGRGGTKRRRGADAGDWVARAVEGVWWR
jgi:hypothetical protein